MLKRKKPEKEMGGAEWLRAKKKKKVNAGCSQVRQIISMVAGRRSAWLQSARPVMTRDPAASGRQLMLVCRAVSGRVVIFRPVESSSLCFWMCSGHTFDQQSPIHTNKWINGFLGSCVFECAPQLGILWSSHLHPPPHASFISNSSFTLIIKHTQ